MSFDLKTMLELELPDGLCPACYAVLCMNPMFDPDDTTLSCPVCLINFDFTLDNWSEYFAQHKNLNLQMRREKQIKHAYALASIVSEYQANEINAIELLLRLLNASKHFVHFSTFSFSTELIGMLATTASRIPVRGLIGERIGIEQDAAYKIFALRNIDAMVSGLDITLTGQSTSFDETHHKIYIFDGIVALHGSTNLSLKSWLAAATAHDQLTVESRPREVRLMNNRFISRFFNRDKGSTVGASNGR